MPKVVEPTLTWEDAPDVLTPRQLARILGVSARKATEIFNSKDFPAISEVIEKKAAYKYDVAEFLGIKLRQGNMTSYGNESVMAVLQQILEELKRKNQLRDSIITQL